MDLNLLYVSLFVYLIFHLLPLHFLLRDNLTLVPECVAADCLNGLSFLLVLICDLGLFVYKVLKVASSPCRCRRRRVARPLFFLLLGGKGEHTNNSVVFLGYKKLE